MNHQANLIDDGPDLAAQAVKLRIMSKRERYCVHVDPAGELHMTAARKVDERSRGLPDSWMVGVYGSDATTAEIAEDMHCRLIEIREMGGIRA